MKKVLEKIDWVQIAVTGLSIVAYLAKSMYETKRFNENLNKRYDDNFDKRVSDIVEKKLNSKWR